MNQGMAFHYDPRLVEEAVFHRPAGQFRSQRARRRAQANLRSARAG